MTAPQRLTTAQASMLEAAKAGPVELPPGQAHAAKLRTASSLAALGLGHISHAVVTGVDTFKANPEAVARYMAELKEWQKNPKKSGRRGEHGEFAAAVILRLDGRELARWRKLAAKNGQDFKHWARDAFLAHEAR